MHEDGTVMKDEVAPRLLTFTTTLPLYPETIRLASSLNQEAMTLYRSDK